MGHQCPLSLQHFMASSRLDCHLWTNTDQGPYSCVICSKDFERSELLQQHLETHADLGLSSVASEDVDIHSSELAFGQDVSHLSNNHFPEAGIGDYTSCLNNSGQSNKTEGLNGDEDWNGLRWDCAEDIVDCHSVSQSVEALSINLNRLPKHSIGIKGKPHQCEVCTKCFVSPYKLRRHQLTHTGERPFQCPVCDKAFRQLSHLKLHTQSHCKGSSGENRVRLSDVQQAKSHNEQGSQFYGKTATGNHTETGVPAFAKHAGFTVVDVSPPEMSEQVCINSFSEVEYPYKTNQMIDQFPPHFIFQEKVSSNVQDSAEKNWRRLSEFRAKEKYNDKELHDRKSYQGSAKSVTSQNQVNDNQTPLSSVSKLTKTAVLQDLGQIKTTAAKGPHACQICFKRFSVPSKLHRHMLIHSGQRPFACHICGKSFRQQCHLKFHLRSKVCLKPRNSSGLPKKDVVGNVSGRFPVGESKALTLMSKKKAHSSDGTAAAPISSCFDTRVQGECVARRVTKVASVSQRPYKSHAGSHRQGAHKPPGQVCVASGRDVPGPIRRNALGVVHECTVCLKCFSSPSKLKRHCLIHTGQRPFPCSICKRAFRQITHLKVHYKVHERSSRWALPTTNTCRAPTPRPKVFMCNLCGWTFKHQTHLTVHLQRHKTFPGLIPVSAHTKTSELLNPGESVWHNKSQTAEKVMSDMQGICIDRVDAEAKPWVLNKSQHCSLTSDISGHENRRYACSVCNKFFISPSKLHRHSLCHYALKPSGSLSSSKVCTPRVHVRTPWYSGRSGRSYLAIQTGDSLVARNQTLNSQSQADTYPYPTEANKRGLGNVLPMQTSLTGHSADPNTSRNPSERERSTLVTSEGTAITSRTSLKATSKKMHSCNICQRLFSVPSKLSRHLLIHMGIKPFTCNVCGRAFRQSCHLQTHMRTHGSVKKAPGVGTDGGDGARQDGGPSPSRLFTPASSSPLKENTNTAQNATHQRPLQSRCQKQEIATGGANRNEHLPHARSQQLSSERISCCNGYGDASYKQEESRKTQSDLKVAEIKEIPKGGCDVREVCPSPDRLTSTQLWPTQEVNDVDGAISGNQVFIDLPLHNTRPQQELPVRRSDVMCHQSDDRRMLAGARVNRCSICLKKFTSPSKLARHFLIHMGIKPFKCQLCAKTFRQFCHLQTHMKIHRGRMPREVDSAAGMHSLPSDGLDESQMNQEDCVLNAHEADTSQDLSHLELSLNTSCDIDNQMPVPAACDQVKLEQEDLNCDFADISEHQEKMTDFTALSKHLRSTQDPVLPQQTSTTMSTAQAEYFKVPLMNKEPGLSHPCPSTAKAEPTILKDGSEGHDTSKSHDQADSYTSDMSPVTREDEPPLPETLAAQSTDPRPKEEVLEVHFEIEQADQRLTRPPEDMLVCSSCSRAFTTQQQFHLHKCVQGQAERKERAVVTARGYQCAICLKSFTVPSKLKRHCLIHTGQRPFQCSLCSKCFTQASHLKTHLRTHKQTY